MAIPSLLSRAFCRAKIGILIAFASFLSSDSFSQTDPGRAVTLNGSSYVRTTRWGPDLFNSENFTFELWFNAAAAGVILNETDTADAARWDYAFAEVTASGGVMIGVPGLASFNAGTVAFNTWNHLALTYNADTQTLTAYMNGAPSGSSTGPRTAPGEQGRSAVYCLGRGGPRNLGLGAFLRGQFDEVRIWRVARTAAQIASNWNRIHPGTAETGLMSVWHFDAIQAAPQTFLSPDSGPNPPPDGSTPTYNPAWYVPDNQAMPLVTSTIPVAGAVPAVFTQSAAVSGRNATLRGSGIPRGTSMSVFFEWGLTTTYGNTTPSQDIGSGLNEVSFEALLENLAPGTYHFRASALSGGSTLRGADQIFTIVGPAAVTSPAVVTGRSAQLRGVANPRGVPMSVRFDWGPTTEYGNQTALLDIGSGSTDVSFTADIADLTPGTYHFRAVGVTPSSTVFGADQSFVIAGPAVSVTSVTVTGRTAQLRATANPQGFASAVRFEWGATTAYGNLTPSQDIGSGVAPVNFLENLNDLSPGTYHVRALITYSGTTVPGENATFTITAPSVQTVSALPAGDTAELRGTVTPQGFPIAAYFEWGTTDFSNTTERQNFSGLQASQPYSFTIRNLPVGSYQFRAVIDFGGQITRGETMTFTILGTAGRAARLSGSSYIRTTTWSNDMFDDEDFTIELWFKAESPGVLINEADTSDVTRWDYAFAELLPGGIIKAGAPGVPSFTVGTIPFNTWHHISVVYDGTAKVMYAYLDGQPAGSSAGDRETPREVSRTSVYCIGRGGMFNLGPGNFLSGFIDNARFWRRPLSALEISQLYNKVIPGMDIGLMANWHFDVIGTGAQAFTSPDASGNNNHAWYVPDNVAMPIEASGAPLATDQRPAASGATALSYSPGIVSLRGSVSPRGLPVQYFFEYGRNGAFQQTAPVSLPAGEIPVAVEATIPVLADVQYEFRLVASNAQGSAATPFASFASRSWPGNALRFTDGDYIRTATQVPAATFPTKSTTIEVWFKPTAAGVIAGENNGTSASGERSLIEILASGSVEARFTGLTPISLGSATLNEWNHVAIRYDEPTQTMHGFLNGVKSSSRVGTRSPIPNQNYTFGRVTANNRIGTGESFKGDMDEIRVWNVARSDDDIVSWKNLIIGQEADLVFYWRLDSISGTAIPDNGPRGIAGVASSTQVVPSTAPLSFGLRIAQNLVETQFFGVPNSPALLQSTSNFTDWTTEAELTVPASGVVRTPITIAPGTKLFRLIPRPPQ